MKANKFFLGLALVGAILTGCEKDPQTQTGEFDTTSYMSVSIAQAGGTRATTDGGFIDGTGNEILIKVIDFYFYKENGEPFSFTAANMGEGNTPYLSNLYTYNTDSSIPTKDKVDSPNNIDEVTDATLVINHNKGNIPTYMIAVINSTTKYDNKDLAEVKKAVVSDNGVNEDGTHIMTNSVYKGAEGYKGADDTRLVMETPIAVENLAITEDKAKAAPVKIYVERTAARVSFDVKKASGTPVVDVTQVPVKGDDNNNYSLKYADGTSVDVYAKIEGWNIVTYAKKGTLAKTIDPSWADDKFKGFNWNQAALYRSYWAQATKADADLVKEFTWKGLGNTIGSVDYCLENTTALPDANSLLVEADGSTSEDLDITRTNVTKVVIAATLVNNVGNALNIYNWFGSNYKTEEELLTAVAQSLRNKLVLNGTPIAASDIQLVENVNANMKEVKVGETYISEQYSYEVYFDLKTTGEWKDPEGNVVDASAILKAIRNAKVWKDGMAYYIVNIEHLGNNTDDYKEGYYGIVRNHAYEITFSGIKGLGTPVYSATTEYPEPVTPDFTDSYVAAEINILSWHLVQQDVILGQ